MKSKVFDIINDIKKECRCNIELHPWRNFVSENIKRSFCSCIGSKYSDRLAEYCSDKWREAFDTDYHVNVLKNSVGAASFVSYMAAVNDVDDINRDVVSYREGESGLIDYERIEREAAELHPKMIAIEPILCSREIDYKKISTIAKENNSLLMVNISDAAGLIIAKEHESPFGLADIIISSTERTLRGPKGYLVFYKPELTERVDEMCDVTLDAEYTELDEINRYVAGEVAAKAVAAEEACTEKFKRYVHDTVFNAVIMAKEFADMGYDVVTGGTDTHLIVLDFSKTHPDITDDDIVYVLGMNGISVMKVLNSKIYLSTAAMTTKGYTADDFVATAHKIDLIIKEINIDG